MRYELILRWRQEVYEATTLARQSRSQTVPADDLQDGPFKRDRSTSYLPLTRLCTEAHVMPLLSCLVVLGAPPKEARRRPGTAALPLPGQGDEPASEDEHAGGMPAHPDSMSEADEEEQDGGRLPPVSPLPAALVPAFDGKQANHPTILKRARFAT